MFASVVVDVPVSNTDHFYDYLIPAELMPFAQIGVRVKVPFGRGNRVIMGYILAIVPNTRFEGEIKQIIDVLDLVPVISQEMLELAEYIRNDTISPLVRVLNQMIPKYMRLKTTKYLIVKNQSQLEANLALSFDGKEKIKWHPSLPHPDAIKRAIDKGYLEVVYDAKSFGSEKIVDYYTINKLNYPSNKSFLKREREKDFLDALMLEGEALLLDEMQAKYDISRYAINKLFRDNYLTIIKQKVSRIKQRIIPSNDLIFDEESLSKYEKTFNQLISQADDKAKLWIPCNRDEENALLALIVQKAYRENKNSLILCPDILSSYQVSSYLYHVLGLEIACLNSNRTDAEIYDYYYEIKTDNYPVIVTTSMGSLFPYQNIGQIIMFDSESLLYRNDQSPRYYMPNVLIKRASIWGANLILHSLVPDLTMYSQALVGDYYLVENKDKKSDAMIKIVDMGKELISGNKLPLSTALIKTLKDHIGRGNAALLILNARGYSNFIICRSCGETLKCEKCAIALRYHKEPNHLVCPLCNKKTVFDHQCPKCGSKYIRHIGLGIEKLQEALHEVLPSEKVITIDRSNYQDYEEKMDDIINQEAKLVIASDLFSRSIKDDNISLVAIIALDLVAKAERFDAHYQAYAMIEHAKMHLVHPNSELIVQTYDPKMPFLPFSVTDDYLGFFQAELKLRELLAVEPIYYLNRIIVKGPYEQMFQKAHEIKTAIRAAIKYNLFIIGPTYNRSEKGVQLIVKHRNKDIDQLYLRLYKLLQDENYTIIFDKYPKNIV